MKKLLMGILCICLCGCGQSKSEDTTLLLAAAASLEKPFVEELIPMFEQSTNIQIEGTYDSSGKLQKQIEEGLDADIFFSAAKKQMDALIEEDLIDANSKKDLLQNKLVLVKHKNTETKVKNVGNILDAQMIAIGDPQSVPAGQYAQKVLEKLGLYEAVIAQASLGSNATEVLNWVNAQSAEVGLIYSTDAKSLDTIEIIEEIDDELVGEKVIYPVAITKQTTKREAAEKFMEFLSSEEAKDVFEKYGFNVN